jgi:hypothetical protein
MGNVLPPPSRYSYVRRVFTSVLLSGSGGAKVDAAAGTA